MTLFLKLEKYLAEWLINEFGGVQPVQFSRGTHENDILYLFLSRQPARLELEEEIKDLTPVEIQIPYFKNRDPNVYNYLPNKARKLLARAIYVRFRYNLWEELHKLENFDANITELIYAWMEKHGIEDDTKSWETIRQMYFRQRKKYKCEKRLNVSESV